MKNIRNSIFETNSSSSHSITIARTSKLLDSISPDKDKYVHIYPDDFGWGKDIYKDPLTKASYCYVYAKNYSDKSKDLELLTEVLLEQTGAEKIVYHRKEYEVIGEDGNNYFYAEYGSIDHESTYVCAKAFKNKNTLKRFIFNKESVLIIDNDNS